ncbi:MAG TPA: immunity 53 family protein [Holophagaceae bacterium]|nr:immunity 53 family protein [Holophagaceae bacterium]
MDTFERLQQWYLSECNGDWEHAFGVKIDTLDNPGWIVRVDLTETKWENLVVSRVIDRRSETDWIQFEANDKQFVSCGGPLNLREMVDKFFEIIEQ